MRTDKDPYYRAGYACGDIFIKSITAICVGLVIGFGIVYFKWITIGLIILLVIARLAMDFYQLNIKGEGDVKDDK